MDANTTNLSQDLKAANLAALRLLAYSWADIDFQYSKLTLAERGLITEKEFQFLLHMMKSEHII